MSVVGFIYFDNPSQKEPDHRAQHPRRPSPQPRHRSQQRRVMRSRGTATIEIEEDERLALIAFLRLTLARHDEKFS